MNARYTREALADLDQISTYLAQRNPAVAGGFLNAVESVVERLSRFPLSAQETKMPNLRAARRYIIPTLFSTPRKPMTSLFIIYAMPRAFDRGRSKIERK